jgi:hypothetical protein
MPLSKPAPRQHLHTRDIKCMGFLRDDGLWDIEGTITDTKTYSFDNHARGGIASGEPIHHMRIRLTIDNDLVIHQAEASTESSPYDVCPTITAAFGNLKGAQIGAGWRRKVAEVMGRTLGCTHLRDLLSGPVAVTAYQTIIPKRRREEAKPDPSERPAVLNTCIAYAEDGPIVQQRWPDFYKDLIQSE